MLDCLVSDIGNTNAHFAIWKDDALFWHESFLITEDLSVFLSFLRTQLAPLLRDLNIPSSRTFASSVNPVHGDVLLAEAASELYPNEAAFKKLDYRHSPLSISYAHPERLGTDRIANAVAGIWHFPQGVIVVDLGTATHLDIATPAGVFLAGPIAPGLRTAQRALHQAAPHLAFEDRLMKPRIIARNTEEALFSGMIFNAVGGILYTIQKVKESLEFSPAIILTGGNAPILVPYLKGFDAHLPQLTLEGVARFFDYTKF